MKPFPIWKPLFKALSALQAKSQLSQQDVNNLLDISFLSTLPNLSSTSTDNLSHTKDITFFLILQLSLIHTNNTKTTISYKNFEASHVQGCQKVQIHFKELNSLIPVTLSLLLLLLPSSSPLYGVYTLIFLRQTMSLGNRVLQLFCCYYSWCLHH